MAEQGAGRRPADTIMHIGDLTPDHANARKHNPRNIGMLVESLQEVGAARSIVIDEHGRVLAGNGTIDAAAQAGIERVVVVDADGETIVAVRRTGLSEAQKRRLALLDNRTAELATWDVDQLQAADPADLQGLFSPLEMSQLLKETTPPAAFTAIDPDALDTDHTCPRCGYEWSGGGTKQQQQP